MKIIIDYCKIDTLKEQSRKTNANWLNVYTNNRPNLDKGKKPIGYIPGQDALLISSTSW